MKWNFSRGEKKKVLKLLPVMEAVSIGLQRFNWDLINSEIFHNLIFDYLESHQFDISYFANV